MSDVNVASVGTVDSEATWPTPEVAVNKESTSEEAAVAISDIEYEELIAFKRRETELRNIGFQAYENLSELQQNFEQAQAQLKDAETSLTSIKSELSTSTEAYNTRFREIVSSYGIVETDDVMVSETSPHLISARVPSA